MPNQHHVQLQINATPHVLELEPRTLLIDVLRDQLGLTGTKEGCSVGVCGACTVLIDGELASACLVLASRCNGKAITTIEGVAGPAGELDVVQQAFVDNGGFQCGICTPGMVLTTKALLAAHPNPTDAEIESYMMGSLCRCTGYYGIAASVRAAAEALAEEAS